MTEPILKFISSDLLSGQLDSELTATDDLLEGGLIDSMGIMRLIAFLEEEFNTKIPPQDMIIDHFITVEAICNYLQSKNP